MNRKGKRFPFEKDPKLLERMLNLRKQGWSLIVLSEEFNVDHSSIIYQCKKAGVVPDPGVELIKKKYARTYDTKLPELPQVYGELKINRGHNYSFFMDLKEKKEWAIIYK